MRITLFINGLGMAFEDGQQVPAAQKPWLVVFAEYLKSEGIDPLEQEVILPSGETVEFFETEDGSYNWQAKGVKYYGTF